MQPPRKPPLFPYTTLFRSRSLAPDPQVLLMDEPFAALDALTRDQLYDDIQRIWHDSRKTIVFVTHNVREAVCLGEDRKSTRLNSSHVESSYAVFCLKKKLAPIRPRIERGELQGERLYRRLGGFVHLPHPDALCKSEEHTSELQSPVHLVCRLLLEHKKNSRIGRIPRLESVDLCSSAIVLGEIHRHTACCYATNLTRHTTHSSRGQIYRFVTHTCCR